MNSLQTKVIAVVLVLILVFELLTFYLSIRGGLI
jgi:hypothetical protein